MEFVSVNNNATHHNRRSPINSLVSDGKRLGDMLFPVSYISPLEGYLSSAEFDSVLLLAGISNADVIGVDAKITGLQFEKVLQISAERYQYDYPLSLFIGKRFNIAIHGILGLAILASASIGEAIVLGKQYIHLVMPAVVIDTHLEKNQMTINLKPNVALRWGENVLIEVSMCVLKSFLEQCQTAIPIEEVSFSHQCSSKLEDYQTHFSCPVVFGNDKNQMTVKFNEADYQRPMKQSDVHTANLLIEQLKLQDQSQLKSKPWLAKTEAYCQKNIFRIAAVSKQEVADDLHITTRTLTRKLLKEGCSFQSIVDALIQQSASHFLINTDLGTQQIADRLGFSSQKVFSRTFKRVSGLSPTVYRRQTPPKGDAGGSQSTGQKVW
ncbi:hypothetical protein A9Q99_17450 [Gammaproteobacteria bacterium 45_16_T64]|nr:hypothetical protein A9Q99_17450 [Gammaproteobacteria bacterium 45_16_T64]